MAMSFCRKRIASSFATNIFKVPKRQSGYVVLLPEIGDDLPDKDPLLKESNKLPDFENITAEKCIAAIARQAIGYEQSIQNTEENLKKLDTPDADADLIRPLEEAFVPLQTSIGITQTFYFVNQKRLPPTFMLNIRNRLTSARGFLGTKTFDEACTRIRETKLNLTDEQKRIIDRFTYHVRTNGALLNEKQKKVFGRFMFKIETKRMEYRTRLQNTFDLFNFTISNPNVVKDFPLQLLKLIAKDPSQPHKGPWNVTLDPFIVKLFVEHCPDAGMRKHIYRSNYLKGSLSNDTMFQTSSALEDIRDFRSRIAKLLGYTSWADLKFKQRMAETPEDVNELMTFLLESAFPAQQREIEELKAFARERAFDDKIDEWDVPYWQRKQRRTVYNCRDEDIKPYFPITKVLPGFFNFIEKLFNLRIQERSKVDVWHKDVRFFDVFDLNQSDSEPIGHIYLDLYARDSEKILVDSGNSFSVAMQNKSVITDSKPIAAGVFNFEQSKGDVPALLSLDDVHSLFEKFGSILQIVATKTNYNESAGVWNLEWDAVHICNHFLTHWLYRPSIMKSLSGHYETGEQLPDEIIDNLSKVKSHMAGYQLCREIFLSRFDLELHTSETFWTDTLKELWPKHFVFPIDKENSFVTSWDTVWMGEWGASYYSHVWSRMVAADLYDAFDEIPEGDEQQLKEIGSRFRETFLALGSSYPTCETFRRFRGRDPSAKALLKHLNLLNTQPIEQS